MAAFAVTIRIIVLFILTAPSCLIFLLVLPTEFLYGVFPDPLGQYISVTYPRRTAGRCLDNLGVRMREHLHTFNLTLRVNILRLKIGTGFCY